jgi:hypothetical protein
LNKKGVLIFLAFLNLLVGLLIYLIFDRDIKLLHYFNFSGKYLNYPILRNHFSDFFYMLFICFLSHFYITIKISKIYISMLLFSPFLHEILQFYFFGLGTFDLYDLILYFIVSLTYYLFIYRRYEH